MAKTEEELVSIYNQASQIIGLLKQQKVVNLIQYKTYKEFRESVKKQLTAQGYKERLH